MKIRLRNSSFIFVLQILDTDGGRLWTDYSEVFVLDLHTECTMDCDLLTLACLVVLRMSQVFPHQMLLTFTIQFKKVTPIARSLCLADTVEVKQISD